MKETFELYLKQGGDTPFTGWDFSYITKTGRMVEAPLKWNYYNLVLPYLSKADTMLDIGTGGGEVLSRFQPLPPNTYATEQYHSNVAVARKRLEPLGVKVTEIEEGKGPPSNANLPFDNEFFDLIINRHEAYYPPELMRILKPGGVFITQQVGKGLWNIKKLLTGKDRVDTGWNLGLLRKELELAGFKIIEAEEDVQSLRFYDVGAIAYWLKAVPWIIEGFVIDEYLYKLRELHHQINQEGFYDSSYDIFFLIVRK